MIEAAIVVARLLQYLGAAILFGSSLLFVYALPTPAPRARVWVAGAAMLLAVSSLLAIAAQASLFAGSFADGVTAESMGVVVTGMDLGKAAVVRAVVAGVAAALLLVLPASRSLWMTAAGLGAVATASLAWLGHGAATEGALGTLHLASDILHALAAALWVGALACFVALLARRHDALPTALERFSGVGPAIVAVVVLTGLINGWILVGPENAGRLLESPYGRLLAAKLALFLVMLALAALNRFRLTALLHTDPKAALPLLKRSVAAETAAGVAILAVVAWLGTLAPPASA